MDLADQVLVWKLLCFIWTWVKDCVRANNTSKIKNKLYVNTLFINNKLCETEKELILCNWKMKGFHHSQIKYTHLN